MRNSWIIPLAVVLAVAVLVEPALAQTTPTNPYNVSWSALSPGNDWAAQVIQSLFPVTGTTASPGTSPGQETTVIQQIVGQLTGFVGAIACAFVAYTTIMNIHRAAESSRILGQGQSWMFVVRVGFAGIMMFPLGGGFSAGQAMVMQAAMVGVGMAKAVYTHAIQAVGPDAAVIAQPMIPGTQQIVAGLIDNELCMDLVNLAGNTPGQALVPIPQPVAVSDNGNGGYITYRYSLSTGDESGDPACGTVTVRESLQNQQTVAGVSIDMAAVQQALLNNVLTGTIRPQVQAVAQNLWQNKTAASLAPLQGIYASAVSTYTSGLTAAAQATARQLNAAVQANATQARNGTSDLLQNEVQQSTLGWTAAGAYYLEIAKLNAATLSLLSATPVTTSPTYDGIPPGLSYDLAPLESAARQFMTTLSYVVQSSDPTQTPNGVPHTLTDAKNDAAGADVLSQLFGQMNLTNAVLQKLTGFILPQTQIWTDPFGGLMSMGQLLINTSLIAMGSAAILSSATASTGAAVWSALTFNWGAAAATVAGHALMSFLGTPIFAGLLAILVPGITIAYILPMIPYVMWMAGVAGWIILVCEAMIAVPLWMLAHMTVGGDGLHGRAIEGWGLLFNVVFRPTLMVIGLFLGYFVFDCMSWLIRQSFGIAAGFVLANGWLVSNFIGLGVLLSIFVMTHVVAALMSFRMVALLPHHLPRLIGFTAANRVDMDDFQQRAAWAPGGEISGGAARALGTGARQFGQQMQQLRGRSTGLISGATEVSGAEGRSGAGMDTTLRATSGSPPETEGETDV
jgi:conjugal transfer/type IV secretion protein DotA/TraY